jgi:hypothetical protein
VAVYTPAQLITPAVMGNGAANIATWRNRDTALVNVHRTTIFDSVSARHVTLEVGATAADTAPQVILNAYLLTISVPAIFNWWIVAKINDYFEGFADNTDVVGSSSGYTYG